MENKRYICVDLKSFFASVECVERGLDPMTASLAVADGERGEGTICLAVSVGLKKQGVKNRCRLYEIPKGIKFIIASPRMKLYMEYSARVYGVYLEFFCDDDVYVYSVDEAFIDVTPYLKMYNCDEKTLAKRVLERITAKTGLRASCGIGTNLYLAKIALDISAKHSEDFIGCLDEEKYKKDLWDHVPITDFWQIGKGTAARLARFGIYTMRGISLCDEDLLYRCFGINAQILIDHSFGVEPVEIKHIKSYKNKSHSISSGQVLMRDYEFDEALVVLKEMIYELCLRLTASALVCHSVTMTVMYSARIDCEPTRGTVRAERPTDSYNCWSELICRLYYEKVSKELPIRRLNLSCMQVKPDGGRQVSIFDNEDSLKELKLQRSVCGIKARFGKNSVVRALDLKGCATSIERNMQIGGHKSG